MERTSAGEARSLEELREELRGLVAREARLDAEALADDATFETLGFASVDLAILLVAVEDTYDVYLPADEAFVGMRSLGDLLDLLSARVAAARAARGDDP